MLFMFIFATLCISDRNLPIFWIGSLHRFLHVQPFQSRGCQDEPPNFHWNLENCEKSKERHKKSVFWHVEISIYFCMIFIWHLISYDFHMIFWCSYDFLMFMMFLLSCDGLMIFLWVLFNCHMFQQFQHFWDESAILVMTSVCKSWNQLEFCKVSFIFNLSVRSFCARKPMKKSQTNHTEVIR